METIEILERLRRECGNCDDPCLGTNLTEAQVRYLGAWCVLTDGQRGKYICTVITCKAYDYCHTNIDGVGVCDTSFADKTYL